MEIPKWRFSMKILQKQGFFKIWEEENRKTSRVVVGVNSPQRFHRPNWCPWLRDWVITPPNLFLMLINGLFHTLPLPHSSVGLKKYLNLNNLFSIYHFHIFPTPVTRTQPLFTFQITLNASPLSPYTALVTETYTGDHGF